MKTAASIFSWLGGIVTTIEGFVYLSQTGKSYIGGKLPPIFWVIFVIFVIIIFIILIWRQNSVENGSKVACGICTLLFVSLIGGILTLCIPEEQLTGGSETSSYTSSSTHHYSEEEKNELIKANDNLLQKGIITQEEYNNRIRKINGKDMIVVPMGKDNEPTLSKEEIDKMISWYKNLLDNGTISKEEFEKKKTELLARRK